MRCLDIGYKFLRKTVVAIASTVFISMPISAQTHYVDITNFEFKPSTLTVSPGDSVIFTNRDIVPHTATANDQTWDTGVIDNDASREIQIEANFSSGFYCKYHLIMTGALNLNE